MELEQRSIMDKILNMTNNLGIDSEPEVNEEEGMYECNACMRVRGDIIKCDTCTYHSCTECREQFEEKTKICAGCRQSIIKPVQKTQQKTQQPQINLKKYLLLDEQNNKIRNPASNRYVIKTGQIGKQIINIHNQALAAYNLDKNNPNYFQLALQIINQN